MATFAEIALKVTANVRDAVRSIETVDKAVEKTDKRIKAMTSQTRQRFGEFGRGSQIGRSLEGILTGASIESILVSAIPDAAILAIVQNISDRVVTMFTETANEALAKSRAAQSTAASPSEAAQNLLASARIARTKAGRNKDLGDLWNQVVDIAQGELSPSVLVGGDQGTLFRRGAVDEFRRLVDQYGSAYGWAILSALPPELEPMRDDLRQIVLAAAQRDAQQQKAAAFRQSLTSKQGTDVTIVNQYSAFAGVGGESTVGREVRQVLDRRDRNNGRYVTPYTR